MRKRKILHLLCLTCQTHLPPALRPTVAVLRGRRSKAEKDHSIDSRRWDHSAEEGEDSEHGIPALSVRAKRDFYTSRVFHAAD